jgi:hypothetical protein
MMMPPMSWMVGTFNDNFSFNCTTIDSANHNKSIKGNLKMPDDQLLNGGWVYRDGKVGRIVKADKRVFRDAKSVISAGIDLKFTDEHGRNFDMRGTLVASCPIAAWNNTWMVINLMRWECEGMVGYGDNQEAFWGDYMNTRGSL